MKELEEVNCEIRRIINLQFPVLNRLRNLETEEHDQSAISQEHDNVNDCRGGFLHNATYAWLSYGCHLVVFNVKIGENVSSWTFRGIVTSVSPLPAQSGEFPLLLVGIDNYASRLKDSSGLLCIFDCTASRVLRAIRMPCGVEQVCVVTGGAEWEEFNDKRPDNVLNEMDGIACVVLRNLQHIMIDLRRSTWDIHNLSSVMDEVSPAEIDLSTKQIVGRHQSNREKHAAYNLLNSRIEKHIGFNRENFESSPLLENLTTAIISSVKIGCLISGCLGRVIIWQNDGSVGWISASIDDMIVTHLALLEPTDDPRPFYYLWVVFQDESLKAPPILRMYAMLFERKYSDRGMNLYFNLEADPSLKFESELSEGDRVINLCTVERESNPEQTDSGAKRGEDNLLLIATNERVLLFDLNQWYKEQMPHTIGECQNPNSILATYRTRSDGQIISTAYVPLSLQEFPSNGPSSPEELFYPNSLSLEWIELSATKLIFWMTRGIQADLLREMALAGPIILIQPSETFHRCLSVGLVPFNSEFSFTSDEDAQREMLLSLCLEQRWSTFLVKCAVEWSDGSASYLYPTFLKWGVQRASTIKMVADRLCVPLFDQSGSSIGEADVKTLRFCSQQLECLSNVVGKLPSTTADLMKQRRMLKRVSTYFQVLLWFYDVGLLPETQDLEEEGTLPISLTLRVPYPYEKLSALYREKRLQFQADSNGGNENEEDLFIDELITRECSVLKAQWEREGGTVMASSYPPPSLQSLLRSYLTDCHQMEANEISCKHQITIYLLMDLAMLLQRLYPAVDQLIKYPSAFKMSPSLIKLTQAFWLLDHEDYQGFLDMMTGQLVSDSDVRDWHHRLILRTLVRNNQHKLALVYLRVRKPPLYSMEEQGVAVSLSVEHGLAQSAFHRRPPCHYEQLLTCFFQACKKYDKLTEILHLALDSEEEEVFIKFLEENKTEDLRLLYYLQRCRYTEAISGHTIRQYQSNFTKNIQSTSQNMLSAYNTTLPDIIKQFSANTTASNMDVDLKARYPRPMSHCKSHDKLRNIYETVIAKAKETYLRGEKCQIPFVSAPCTSLKLNSYSANMNCVLFPALAPKSRGKRTVDQIYEGENASMNDTPDGAKRRKLSDENISSSRQDPKETGLTAVFETPLVKRKLNASAKDKEIMPETPQSILKIKQFIRNCPSPDIALSETAVEVTDGPPGSEKEKKINRQIRFNFIQSKKILMYEEEEEEEKEKEEEEEENDNSLGSNDVFFSPSANEKSAYCESAVLSDNSSVSSSIYPYARPRPSLRRSALQFVESSQEKASDRSANLPATTSLCSDEAEKQFVPNMSTKHSSLASVYSTTVLTSDSSIDVTYPRRLGRSSLSRRRSSMDYKNKSIISSTPMSKVPKSHLVNDEQAMGVNDDEENVNLTLFARKMQEDLDATSNSKKSLNIEPPDYSRSSPAERRDNSEEDSAQGKSQQSETRYNNGSIAGQESPSLQNLHKEQPVSTEIEMEVMEIVTDESEEELLRLQDVEEEEEEEHEEEFESLSMVLEDEQLEMNPVICPSENWNLQYGTEEHGTAKSNGLRESMQVMANVDFTDDETTSSRGVTPVISHETDNNEKEKYSLPTVHSQNVLHDMSNITDDESDPNTREEPKAKNGRVSNLIEHHATQSVDAERNSESDERSQRSKSRRESISKKNASQILSQPDNIDNESSNSSVHSSHKVDSSKVEMWIESQEKLSETKSSSTSKRSQSEIKDSPIVLLTRLHSATKDETAKDDTSLQQAEPEKVTRLRTRRGSSVTKDSPSRNITESLRSRRANSIAKDSPMNSSSQSMNIEELPRLRRATSVTSELTPSEASQEMDLDKPPRLRRASSITKDVGSPSGKLTRGRRASSLVKEVFVSLADEDLVTSEKSVGRSRRSTSVAKEIALKDSDSESIKDDTPVRRSSRLASSVKKESNSSKADTSKSITKSESELVKLISDDEGDKKTRKRSLRARTSSVSSDTEKPTTSRTRKSSRDSKEELEDVEVKTRRRRGNSVPKEATAQTARIRRSSSIIKEIIPEEVEPPEEKTEPRRLRSSTARTADEVVSKLTTKTRSRSASLLSIPEELEEILSPSLRETRSSRKKEALKTTTRGRRAISVDMPHNELKKRVRNIHFKNLASPIIEESVENEEKVQLQEDKKSENEEIHDTPVSSCRRRRAASTSTITEMDKTEKRKRDRLRKTSVNEESSNLFSFSQPEKTNDMSVDEKDIGEVPNYVFSLPKSKIPPDHPRRKMNSFIPSPYQQGEQQPIIWKPDIVEPCPRLTKNTFGSRFRTKFVVPKRSKSTDN